MPAPRQYSSNAERQRAYRERLAQRQRDSLEGHRPRPSALANVPPNKRWKTMRDQARNILIDLQEEMQSYFDDRSEEWQESDRAAAFQERLDALANVLDELDTLEE